METNIRQDNNEEVEIDIMQIIRMLLSKIWIVIVAGVVTAIVAFDIMGAIKRIGQDAEF